MAWPWSLPQHPAADVGSDGQAEGFTDLVELYLSIAWKRPPARQSELLRQQHTATLKVYRRKRNDGMDTGMMELWTKGIWARFVCEEIEDETKEATAEVFRRGGEATMEEYRGLVESIRDEVERARALLDLARGTDMFDMDSYHDLGKRSALLEMSLQSLQHVWQSIT